MKLTVVLFLCVTSFVRAGHQDDSLELDIRKDQTKACGKKIMHITHMAMNITCSTPREKLVTLKSKTGSTIFPSQINLKRCDCDYKCPDNLECVPVQKKMKKHLIAVMFDGSFKRRCLEVELPEHTMCKCGCTKTPNDCNVYQYFDPDLCSCMCNDKETHKHDCKEKGSRFNENTCMCECSTPMTRCSTGFTWSMDYCKCVKVAMNGETGQERPITE